RQVENRPHAPLYLPSSPSHPAAPLDAEVRMRSCLALLVLSLLSLPARAEPLPDTKPLTRSGDLAAQMVEGIDKFLLRDLAAPPPHGVLARGRPPAGSLREVRAAQARAAEEDPRYRRCPCAVHWLRAGRHHRAAGSGGRDGPLQDPRRPLAGAAGRGWRGS